jgi:hypothetical protein
MAIGAAAIGGVLPPLGALLGGPVQELPSFFEAIAFAFGRTTKKTLNFLVNRICDAAAARRELCCDVIGNPSNMAMVGFTPRAR